MSKLLDRFFKYISFNTQANPESNQSPSSKGQKELAHFLADELALLGLVEIELTEKGNLVAKLPANVDYFVPSIAFISHLDASAYSLNDNLTPQFIHNYRGNDILLGRGNGVLSPLYDLALKNVVGKTLVVGDGVSSLSAASKAGIAIIMTSLVEIIKNDIPHGDIKIVFLADQTLLKATISDDLMHLNVDRAYSVDSQGLGIVGVENLNTTKVNVTITGKQLYLAANKNVMTNALNIAVSLHAKLPEDEMRESTSYYEGFYQFVSMSGNAEKVEMEYLICDFSDEKWLEKKMHFLLLMKEMRADLAAGCEIDFELTDIYHNQSERIECESEFINLTEQAIRSCDVEPIVIALRETLPINAKVTEAGTPCISLSNGGYNFNSQNEFVVVEQMQKSAQILQKIVQFTAESSVE